MGNRNSLRLPNGQEMMTLGHLNALLNNRKLSIGEETTVDALNFRIERMIRRLGGERGWNEAKLPLFRTTYLHRSLFVAFLERYQNSVSLRLYKSRLPWSADMFAYLAADILCRVLFLKRSNLGLKLEHSKTWTIAKDFDMVVEFYTFVICLMKRVFKLYFRADPRISLDELGSETIQVLFRRMDQVDFDSEKDVIKELYVVSGFRSKKPKPLFIGAQRKHWVSRLNRAFAGCGQNSRLSESEIRTLFGDVVDNVNWIAPNEYELKRLRRIYEPPPASISTPPPSFDVVVIQQQDSEQKRLANHGRDLMRKSMISTKSVMSNRLATKTAQSTTGRRRHSSGDSDISSSKSSPGKLLLFRGFSDNGSCHL